MLSSDAETIRDDREDDEDDCDVPEWKLLELDDADDAVEDAEEDALDDTEVVWKETSALVRLREVTCEMEAPCDKALRSRDEADLRRKVALCDVTADADGSEVSVEVRRSGRRCDSEVLPRDTVGVIEGESPVADCDVFKQLPLGDGCEDMELCRETGPAAFGEDA